MKIWGTSQVVLVVKNLPASAGNAGDRGLIPGSGRSLGVGNGNPLQYSCLENSLDRGAWWATVHGVAKSWTWLSIHTHTHTHTHRYKDDDAHSFLKKFNTFQREVQRECYWKCSFLPGNQLGYILVIHKIPQKSGMDKSVLCYRRFRW